jgi:hypothetical protein
METVEGQIADFRDSVSSLPRLTSKINKSKHAMTNVLNELVIEFQNSQSMAREAEASFESILEAD